MTMRVLGWPRPVTVAILAMAFALVAAACGSDDGDEQGQRVDVDAEQGQTDDVGEERVVPVAGEWVEIPPGPLDGWNALEVITGGPGSTSFYVFGLRRTFGEYELEYETRESFHEYDTATGEWRELPSPPVNEELVYVGGGVATEDSVYVVIRDCVPAPPLTGAGGPSGCEGSVSSSRGLRFDIDAEAWSEWELPGSLATAIPSLVPGQYPPGSTLFFQQGGELFAYEPGADTWSRIDVDYARACTDGQRVYGFDRAATASALADLAATFTPEAGKEPALHPISVPWVTADPTGVLATEQVTVWYEDHGAQRSDTALEIHAFCTNDGVLVIPRIPRSAFTPPWTRRHAEGEWVEMQPPLTDAARERAEAEPPRRDIGAWRGLMAVSDQVLVGLSGEGGGLHLVDPATGDITKLAQGQPGVRASAIGDSVLVSVSQSKQAGTAPVRLLALDR